jgi:branched-chain amino acid transport system substrate-binding protein
MTFLVQLLTFLSALILLGNPAFAAPRLRVAVINGLTGEWATYGQTFKRALEMAAVENDVEFIFEDDQFLPAKSVSAFNALIHNQKIDALLMGDDATAQAVAPLARKHNIPLFAWASTTENLQGAGVFRLWGSTDAETALLKNELQTKTQRVSIVYSTHPYASKLGSSLCQALGANCVYQQELDNNVSDFRSIILRAGSEKTDSFVLCLSPGLNGLFARQLRELGHNTATIWGCNFFENKIDLEAAQGALNGAHFVAPQVEAQFKQDFEQSTNSSAHLISAALHYDFAKLLAAAVRLPDSKNLPLVDKLFRLAGKPGVLGKFRPLREGESQHLELTLRVYRIEGQLYR